MSLEAWVSISSLLIVALTLAAFTRSTVVGTEARLGKRIDSLDMKIDSVSARIDAVETNLSRRIDKLDDRVYALAIGMKPLLEPVEKNATRATR